MNYQELIRAELAANSGRTEYKRDLSKFSSKSTSNWDSASSFDVDQSVVEDDDMDCGFFASDDDDDDMACVFFN